MASAAPDSDDEGTDHLYSEEIQVTLQEFLNTYTLPQTVAVTQGSFMSQNALLARGDVLVLNGLAPPQVNLTFYEPTTRVKHEVQVSTDVATKFIVLPPKDSVEDDIDSPHLSRQRPLSVISYPTVADLIMDCPTCFEANTSYEDPYLPGFSIRPGDKFRFVKIIADPKDCSRVRLQCRTESGEIITLSSSCRGNFTVLKDETVYTLQELISLAKVPRRLKLAPENGDLIDFSDSSGEDFSGENIFGERAFCIPDLPSKFMGVIYMSRPEDAVDVSPLDNPGTNWKIPVSANLHVRLHRSSNDYEEPVKKKIHPQNISSFAAEYEYQLPVHAGLLRYKDLPKEMADCLRNCKDIVVHEVLHSRKLFVKDPKQSCYFGIRESERIHFVEAPQMFSSVLELLSVPNNSTVQVLADIAADFPQPFILKYGDILRIKKYNTEFWKPKGIKAGDFLKHFKSGEFRKSKNSNTGEVTVLKCERIGPDGDKLDKLRIPLDLEVSMVLKTDPAELKVTDIADIFSGKEVAPLGSVSVVEGKGGSYSCLPTEVRVLQVLTDKELLISPLDSTSAVSPVVNTAVQIPLRHEVTLGFKRKLEFPDGYFVMPAAHQILGESIEEVTESEYEELEHAKKLATEYEDISIGDRNQTACKRGSGSGSTCGHSGASSDGSLPRTHSTGSLEQRKWTVVDPVKRLSKALNPKKWKFSRSAATESEATLPPPGYTASGILTLALQPPQAASNVYQGDVGDSSDLQSPKFKKQISKTEQKGGEKETADDWDDPYEDVDITHPPVQMTKSLQLDQSASSLSSAGQLKMSFSASAENVSLPARRDELMSKTMPKLKSSAPSRACHKNVREYQIDEMGSGVDYACATSAETPEIDSLKKSPKPRRPRRNIDTKENVDNVDEENKIFDSAGLHERSLEVTINNSEFKSKTGSFEKKDQSETVTNSRPKPVLPPKPLVITTQKVPVVTTQKVPVVTTQKVPSQTSSPSKPVVLPEPSASSQSRPKPVAPPRTRGISTGVPEPAAPAEGNGARPKVLPREQKKRVTDI